MAQFAKITDTPENIRNDNRFELLFYGIFSWADVGNPQLATGNAHLKIPFALNSNELSNDASPFAKLVGGYGSLFSGIMVLATVSYLYLVCKRKTSEEKLSFKWLSLALGLIVLASLLSPVPNYARFNGQLALFPVAVATVLIIRQQHKKRMAEKFMYTSLIALLSLNLFITLACASAFDSLAFKSLNTQLTSFRDSRYTYAVYASTFYSNYTMLRQADISIRIASKPLQCKNMMLLDYSRNSTELCRL
jgi:membrane-associated HD superfamily phosphohydrolase